MRERRRFIACLLIVALGSTRLVAAGEVMLEPGAHLETMTIGREIFHHVVIRSVSLHTVVFWHDGGMKSLRLRDLPPEWQARFHFDPTLEPAESAPAATSSSPTTSVAHPARRDVRIDDVLQRFGQPATLQEGVDLRPKFFALDLSVKNQGRRPSCAVFAVVSALEYQNAEVQGKAEKFSEEYLIWATRRSTRKVPVPGATAETAGDDADEGFTLFEVANALRSFGIPLQASMPDTFGKKIDAIDDPPPATVDEARTHQRVFVHPIPARDAPTCVNNIVHALNAGLPVAVGMSWPNYRSLRNGFLDLQKPQSGTGHAVTLVGYTSASGQLKDAVFIFKNSYGAQWGQGGYGTATYNYLAANLMQAVLLEVQGTPSSR